MSVYSYLDYRDAIRETLNIRKKVNSQFTFSSLADALQVQKPYISRVLKGDAHLNSDQLYLACRFLELNGREQEYMSLLLEWGRSVVGPRKKELREKIKSIQEKARGSEEHLKAEMLEGRESPELAEYFLQPLAPLVHIFLTVPAYARDPRLIQKSLALSEKQIEGILQLLTHLKLIEYDAKAKTYRVLQEHVHLRRDSIFNTTYQLLFRQLASEQIKRLEAEDKFLFSASFTIDEETRDAIHEEFNDFIKRVEQKVRSAPAEGVFQMTFDLFRWDPKK